MPNPAEVLLENSTLNSGTPWEHLNAQVVGEGGDPYPVYYQEVILEAIVSENEIVVDDVDIVELEMEEVVIVVEKDEIELEKE